MLQIFSATFLPNIVSLVNIWPSYSRNKKVNGQNNELYCSQPTKQQYQQYQVTPETATFLNNFLLRSCINTLGISNAKNA